MHKNQSWVAFKINHPEQTSKTDNSVSFHNVARVLLSQIAPFYVSQIGVV
jgi:hypothetical protein